VLDDVGERLLHDPVGGQLQPRGQGPRGPLDLHLHRDPGRLGVGGEQVQRREPGLGLGRHVVGAQGAQQPAHVLERAPPGLLDHAQRPGRLLRGLLDQVGAHARLDGDHAHRVGHDVVQVARDPGALIGDGPAGQLLPGLLQGGRLLLKGPGMVAKGQGMVATGRDRHAERPDHHEHDRDVADLEDVDVPEPEQHRGHHLHRREQRERPQPQGPGRRTGDPEGGQRRQGLQQVRGVLQGGPGRVGQAEQQQHGKRMAAHREQGAGCWPPAAPTRGRRGDGPGPCLAGPMRQRPHPWPR
jgi:hypothetical protein